jgi:hypothetical protein
MALVGTEINDLPETPFSYAAIYNSDQLIAGPMQLVTKGQATITGGLALPPAAPSWARFWSARWLRQRRPAAIPATARTPCSPPAPKPRPAFMRSGS